MAATGRARTLVPEASARTGHISVTWLTPNHSSCITCIYYFLAPPEGVDETFHDRGCPPGRCAHDHCLRRSKRHAAAATTSAAWLSGQGPITFVTGKDTSGYLQPLLDVWNAAHPAERVTLVQLPVDADDQHAQMVANLQARSAMYDVLNMDVIWTPEFASAGWIVPLNPDLFPLKQFLPPAVDTAEWDGRLWAAPYTSNAGLLYYRTDILARAGAAPPRTWAQLADLARTLAPRYHMYGYSGQYMLYEGLTVNFAEAVQSAGGAILSGEGKRVVLDSPQARAGLDFLVQGFRAGWIPKVALGWDENKSSTAFEAGKLLFMRNWPLAYGLASRPGRGNQVTGKFGVAALPGPNGRRLEFAGRRRPRDQCLLQAPADGPAVHPVPHQPHQRAADPHQRLPAAGLDPALR